MTKSNLTLKDIYTQYELDNTLNDYYNIDWNTFKQICKLFFKKASIKILEGEVFNLPSNLGRIFIKRFKPSKKKPIDWKTTNELYGEYNKTALPNEKKRVYHKNHHSFGWSGRWMWDKKNNKFKNKTFYKFEAVRNNQRSVSEYIKYKNTINNYEN